MNVVLHVLNVLDAVLPVRETLGFRRFLLRLGGVTVGQEVRITHGVKFYDRFIVIGNHVWLGMNTVIASTDTGKVIIGDNVDIAPCCRITSGTHALGGADRRAGKGYGVDVVIGSGTWIGTGCCIIAGARIGQGCMVAAGSVVIAGEYPPNTLLAGVPATVKRVLP